MNKIILFIILLFVPHFILADSNSSSKSVSVTPIVETDKQILSDIYVNNFKNEEVKNQDLIVLRAIDNLEEKYVLYFIQHTNEFKEIIRLWLEREKNGYYKNK